VLTRSGVAAAGTAVAAALCCLAIPVTVAITGFSDLVALGTNLAIAAIAALLIALIVRSRLS
jgi:low affinity Fe/Cu permease